MQWQRFTANYENRLCQNFIWTVLTEEIHSRQMMKNSNDWIFLINKNHVLIRWPRRLQLIKNTKHGGLRERVSQGFLFTSVIFCLRFAFLFAFSIFFVCVSFFLFAFSFFICVFLFLFAFSFFYLRFLFLICVFVFLFAFSFSYLRFLFSFIFIAYHIPYSLLYLSNGYDF